MFFVGLVVRSPFLKKLCVPLGSHCLLSMWRYFISLVSFDIIACLELKRMEVHLWNLEALLSCQKLCIDECLASASHLSIGHVGPTQQNCIYFAYPVKFPHVQSYMHIDAIFCITNMRGGPRLVHKSICSVHCLETMQLWFFCLLFDNIFFHGQVIEENLDWEDVQWSQTGVWIAGKEYTLARVHFLSKD